MDAQEFYVTQFGALGEPEKNANRSTVQRKNAGRGEKGQLAMDSYQRPS